MAQTKPCRDCGESIEWEMQGGKWIPLDPISRQRHRCQLDQTCEGCGVVFKGAPWMKVCSDCYRNGGKPKDAPAQDEPETPTRAREPLRDMGDDDAPPF